MVVPFVNKIAINKEKNILFLLLFLLLNYGYVGIATLVFSTSSQVVVAAVHSTSSAFTLDEVVAVFGFNFITADIRANSIFYNHHESSFVKSSCIRCAP